MKLIKSITVFLLVTFTLPFFAQSENIFLDRDYWGDKPSVAEVKAKIEEGNDPAEANGSNFDGVTYSIIQNAPLETITFLISQEGNDVNKLTHDGRTYIFWAAYRGNVELMKYLIKNGAKTDVKDDKGSSIINFAAAAGEDNTKVYDLIIAQGIDLKTDLTPKGANALLVAAPSDKDFKLIKYFISKGLDINSVDKDGNGIYNYIAKSGNTVALDKISEMGVKGTDQAFIFAANGMRRQPTDLKVYQYLKDQGFNPNTTNNQGETPLHILAGRGKNRAVFNFLLENGLDVNQKDKHGNTAFMNAASSNDLKLVEFLSKKLKDINTINKKGQSALMLAIANNKVGVVEFLLDHKANTTLSDADGNNLVYYLVDSYSKRNESNFKQKMALLQNHGVKLEELKNDGNTWFHLAVEKNSSDLLAYSIKFQQDINAKNNEGNTALHVAAMTSKDDALLKYLIKNGAEKDAKTDFEETAYDLAKENELLKANNISVEFLK